MSAGGTNAQLLRASQRRGDAARFYLDQGGDILIEGSEYELSRDRETSSVSFSSPCPGIARRPSALGVRPRGRAFGVRSELRAEVHLDMLVCSGVWGDEHDPAFIWRRASSTSFAPGSPEIRPRFSRNLVSGRICARSTPPWTSPSKWAQARLRGNR